MNVTLVSTWGAVCGIAEHAAYLKESVEVADAHLVLTPHTDLHPDSIRTTGVDVVHLNYHASLHSQWHPAHIRAVQQQGVKVLVTYHDTGVPNSDPCKAICAAADCAVVHEPFDDLEGNVHYIRQGVPGWSGEWHHDRTVYSWGWRRPLVGTVGFPFPWKNYDLLCEASALAGWATLILAPGATAEQIAGWSAKQPHLQVITDFTPREQVVAMLAGCDATAFFYQCANTGTSGAIRQGIAARKPVLALAGCRQFRDLEEDGGLGELGIMWVRDGSPHEVARVLASQPLGRVHAPMVALAERDSWASVGRQYAALYRGLR